MQYILRSIYDMSNLRLKEYFTLEFTYNVYTFYIIQLSGSTIQQPLVHPMKCVHALSVQSEYQTSGYCLKSFG